MTGSEPIRAVVDTKLFVSGLLNPKGAPGSLLGMLRSGRFQLVISLQQRVELGDVFSRDRLFRKYGIGREDRDNLLALVDALAEFVAEGRSLPLRVRDPKDVMILQSAVDSAADYLVTEDDDLLDLASDHRLGALKIVTVRAFLRGLGTSKHSARMLEWGGRMGRLPTLTRDVLAPEGQAVWDRIAAVRDGVRGPYEVLIRVPALADRVRALEDYFRFDAALSDAERELIILATGRELGARFAWGVHEPRARQVGTRPEAIKAVRDDSPLDGLTPRERLLVEMVRALLRERALSDNLYARALDDLGERQLVEVVALIGHYSLIGLLLNGFAVPPREGSPGF